MAIFNKLYILLFTLLCVAGAVSCSDDIFEFDEQGGEGTYSGKLTINVSAGEAGISTRSLNMNNGATVNINSLWLGVFEKTTGRRIGSTKIDGFDQNVSSGTLAKRMVTVDFYSNIFNPEVYVLGLSNYEGVLTSAGTPVIEAVQSADNLSQIVELDIDAATAYAGDKGEDTGAQSPFLMGYYLESTGMTRVPKFNQFDKVHNEPVSFYPENASSAMTIKLYTDDKGEMYVPSGALTLRRLVTNVNVKIVPGPGIDIADVSYMAFNQPELVYLVQRRTDVSPDRSYADWQSLSPNRADCFVSEAGFQPEKPVYRNDENWRTDISTDGLGFSFQHFENKHWGFGNITSFSEREAKNADGTLKSLSPQGTKPYNDYASYFKIRMHITDRNTGKNGDVVYTIHEGLCNTDDGRKAETEEERMKDFGSFRNTNYTYTINVNGVEKIVVNASLDEEDDSHLNGQEGTIWQLIYANGDQHQIPDSGGTFGEVNLNESALPAFRIYGNDSNGKLYDICYNFPQNGASWLGGFWPEGTSATIFTSNPADLRSIPQNLLSGLRITDGSRVYTMEEFLSLDRYSGTYRFQFNSYTGPWEENPRENMRALYIFDRNEYHQDYDGCSSFGKIYVAEQYPYDNRPTLSFDKSKVLGHTALHTTSENKWCGTTNSVIDLVWTHDTQFEGYLIEAGGYKEKIPKEDLQKYIKTVSGKKAVVYPYVTDRLAGSETPYDITITPIPANKAYKGEATVISGMLAVYPSDWQVKTTPLWKDLNVNGKTLIDVEYRGLTMYQDHETKNQSVKGSYLSFGGSSNYTTRRLGFYTTKSGKLTVTACSNAQGSGIDTSRYLIAYMVKYDDQNNPTVLKQISRDDEYVCFNNTTCTRTFDINIDEPCYIMVGMTGGNIRVHGIKFEAY